MKRKRIDKPRTTLLYLGRPGRSAGIWYSYGCLNLCFFLSAGGMPMYEADILHDGTRGLPRESMLCRIPTSHALVQGLTRVRPVQSRPEDTV
ncbi:MAG: hypothetical protein LUQ50_00300 [Methanospirillum sp.]|uniref:hypothetical protein n=1 Tax=Methanospirillum sp. TaxID=45200 RepID=UPI00236A8070|nr:hypothetical protein [Methanospirillum sp.]MDD1727491.1 hypothetical protein [Methanospirillum sp.]